MNLVRHVHPKYRSDDDLHILYIAEMNLEVLMCDACREVGENLPEGGGMNVRRMTPEEDAKVRAATLTSAEVAMAECQGHDHAVCPHVYKRLPL